MSGKNGFEWYAIAYAVIVVLLSIFLLLVSCTVTLSVQKDNSGSSIGTEQTVTSSIDSTSINSKIIP